MYTIKKLATPFLLIALFLISPLYSMGAWVESDSGLSANWSAVYSSGDGDIVYATVDGGGIHKSEDYGDSFEQLLSAENGNWRSIDASSDGQTIFAVQYGQEVWFSTDGGGGWDTPRDSINANWMDVAVSADGTLAYFVADNEYIAQYNSGTWTLLSGETTQENWIAVAMSETGQYAYAVETDGALYKNDDFSLDVWEEVTSLGLGQWRDVSVSSDGMSIAVVDYGGYIHTSSDGGSNWTARTSAGSRNWKTVEISPSGSVIIAGEELGSLYLSEDSGATWSVQSGTSGKQWKGIACNHACDAAYAAPYGDIILRLVDDTEPPTITNISSDKANGVYKAGDVIDIDITFSESVTSTGNITITLETGDTDRTCTLSITSSDSGSCNYTVQSGDVSSDLNVQSVSGVIKDLSDNTMISFTPATNLSTNKNIVIDTTAPMLSGGISIGNTFDTTPSYSFNSTENGTISYGGGCSSSTTSAISGQNNIEFLNLAYGTYAFCSITVTDSVGNQSNPMSVTTFYVNAYAAVPIAFLGNTNNSVNLTNPIAQNNNNNTNTSNPASSTCNSLDKNNCNTNITNQGNCNLLSSNPDILKLKMVHSSVKSLQKILNCKGYIISASGPGSSGNETNKFGILTYKAVIKLQKDFGLKEDGIVGPLTRAALNKN